MPPDVAIETRTPPLTNRQRAVLLLVTQYRAVALEMPSAGWVARRLSISRQRAYTHIDQLRRRGWLTR